MNTQPNILLFLPDAMQASTLTPDGDCHTPNFDLLSATGMRFTRAHTPCPTCSPARASLMTGLLPHNHGVLQVNHCVDDDQSVLRSSCRHWAQGLKDTGYRTGYFGKWHVDRSENPTAFGWDRDVSWRKSEYRQAAEALPAIEWKDLDPACRRMQRGAPGYRETIQYGVTNLSPQQREVSVPVNLASKWLREVIGADAPWCCCVSLPEPNEELICSRESFSRYDPASIHMPANMADELADKPALYRRAQQMWRDMGEDDWRRLRACYYARVSEVDAQFGCLLDLLNTAGELENTIVIVTSDHGRYVGAHGLDAHTFGAFEEIYNIPLIVSGPGIASDVTSPAAVMLQDLCPTILDLAGAEPIDVPDSSSFADLLHDPLGSDDGRAAFAEYHGTRYPLAQRILWNGDWKFVFNGFDFDELYNLATDPGELHNLASAPEHRERLEQMMAAVWRVISDTYDKPLIESHYYSMHLAAVGPEN